MSTPEPQYRPLSKGEIIQEGDEYQTRDGKWHPTVIINTAVRSSVRPMRRRIEQEPTQPSDPSKEAVELQDDLYSNHFPEGHESELVIIDRHIQKALAKERARVRELEEELRWWAIGPKHEGDCFFTDKADEGCCKCEEAERDRFPRVAKLLEAGR